MFNQDFKEFIESLNDNSRMIETDVRLPPLFSPALVPHLVAQSCAGEGLTLTLKGTLKQYPNCLHWHYKKGKEPGTLEITWWEQENRLWFKVSAGRRGEWIEETIARLKLKIESAVE